MKIPWYEKLDDIISQYGIVHIDSLISGVQSFAYNGQWIFDRYLNNDFAFMKYNEKVNDLLLESVKPYNYFSFIKTLKQTMVEIKTYQMKRKLNEINEDFV